jgi:hypothetical protein
VDQFEVFGELDVHGEGRQSDENRGMFPPF